MPGRQGDALELRDHIHTRVPGRFRPKYHVETDSVFLVMWCARRLQNAKHNTAMQACSAGFALRVIVVLRDIIERQFPMVSLILPPVRSQSPELLPSGM